MVFGIEFKLVSELATLIRLSATTSESGVPIIDEYYSNSLQMAN